MIAGAGFLRSSYRAMELSMCIFLFTFTLGRLLLFDPCPSSQNQRFGMNLHPHGAELTTSILSHDSMGHDAAWNLQKSGITAERHSYLFAPCNTAIVIAVSEMYQNPLK